MSSSSRSLIPFPLTPFHSFKIGNKRYRLRNAGVQALELAVEIIDASRAGRSLFPFRDRIRELRLLPCAAALSYAAERISDNTFRLIVIWLRGFRPGSVGTPNIARFARVDQERLRAAAAKTLRRMNAGTALNHIMATDPSERVRRLAAPPTSPFLARLGNYASHVSPLPASTLRRPMWISPSVVIGKPFRGKTVEWIRQTLERIRELVYGGRSPSSRSQG